MNCTEGRTKGMNYCRRAIEGGMKTNGRFACAPDKPTVPGLISHFSGRKYAPESLIFAAGKLRDAPHWKCASFSRESASYAFFLPGGNIFPSARRAFSEDARHRQEKSCLKCSQERRISLIHGQTIKAANPRIIRTS